jgi:hypothetical protein
MSETKGKVQSVKLARVYDKGSVGKYFGLQKSGKKGWKFGLVFVSFFCLEINKNVVNMLRIFRLKSRNFF